MRGLLLFFCLLITGGLAQAGAENPTLQATGDAANGAAMQAYRGGEYQQAITHWRDRLEGLGPAGPTSAQRGHLCYNVGNAYYRAGDPMRAIAWYQAGLRHLPRQGDIRANLAFVRGEAGLGPAKGDGFGATLWDLISRWTQGEAKRLALLGLALVALFLFLEAVYGGALWRWFSLGALTLAVLLALPLLRHGVFPDQPESMVISERNTSGRSEPRVSAKSLMSLEASELVYPEDEWQDWVKVRTKGGASVWLDRDKVVSVWR